MKKITSLILALGMLASSMSLNSAFASENTVSSFNASDSEVVGTTGVEVTYKYDYLNGHIAVNPNYTKDGGIIIKPNFTVMGDVFLKVRYYIAGTFNENNYAVLRTDTKQQQLFDYVGKKANTWYEEIVHIGDLGNIGEYTYIPMTSANWTMGNDIYIDYIGFFGSEQEARSFSEPDDSSSTTVSSIITAPEVPEVKIKDATFVNGYQDRYFMPDNSVTRAEAGAMIARIMAADANAEIVHLSDVHEGAWYYDYVMKLASNGIVEPEGIFRPNDVLTRRELAKMLWNMGRFDASKVVSFNDISLFDADYAILNALGGNGVMVGDQYGNFMPDNAVTRAQIVAIINRILGTDTSEAYKKVNPYADVTTAHWAYADIITATATTDAAAEGGVQWETINGVAYDIYNTRDKVWEPVPLVSQEIKDAGYLGGEGGQAILDLAIDTTGQILMSFSDAGALFVSEDGGNTWERRQRDVNAPSLSNGEIDPNNSHRVIAYTHKGQGGQMNDRLNFTGNGVYISDNTGYSFKLALPTCDNESGWRQAFAWDPTSYDKDIDGSSICYFTTCDKVNIDGDKFDIGTKWLKSKGLSEGPGFYRSTDGGYTWKMINEELGGSPPAVCPANGWVFACNESGLFRSKDHGDTWEKIISGNVGSVTTVLTMPNNLWISDDQGILVSADGGESFSRINNNGYPGKFCNNLSVSPVNPDRMIISYNPEEITKVGSYVSHDGGVSWEQTLYDASLDFYRHQPRWKITIWSPTDENKAWTTSDWVESSENGAKSFHWNHNNNCGSCINSRFFLNVYNPDYFLVPAQDFNGAVTFDGGETFRALWTFPGYAAKNHSYGGYCVDENTFFWCHTNSWEAPESMLTITHDGGQTFKDIGMVTSGARNNYCLQSQVNPNVYFAGNMRSEDAGYTWEQMPENISTVCAYNPTGKELFARGKGGKACYVSTDTGITWTKLFDNYLLYDNPDYSEINEIAYDHINNIVYFEEADKVLKYQNGQITVLNCDIMKDRWRTALAVDPIHPNVIYTGGVPNGVEGFTSYDYTKSIFRSCDGGETWQVISSADTTESIVPHGDMVGNYYTWAMFVHPKTGEVYIGMPNYGVYKFAPPYELEQ